MAEHFDLGELPQRSNLRQQPRRARALGAMVVAGPKGFPQGGQYRKWNIRRAQTNDDFRSMMREVFTCRFGRWPGESIAMRDLARPVLTTAAGSTVKRGKGRAR